MTTALEGMRGQRHAPAALYPPGEDPVRIVQEVGWVAGPVWTGAENLANTGIRSPDRPARSQSLYRLSYPVHPELKAHHLIPSSSEIMNAWNYASVPPIHISLGTGHICST